MVPKPSDIFNEANEYMLAGEYSEALPLLISLQERGYGNANISYKIGECYLQLPGKKVRAVPFLKEAVKSTADSCSGDSFTEVNAPRKAFLYLGIAYRTNYNFTEAVRAFEVYREFLAPDDNMNRMLVQYHMERCGNAQELIHAPATFTADTLPGQINTQVSNFNPLITAGEKSLFYMNQLKFYDAVMLTHRVDTIWTEPENLTPVIKSDGDHYVTGTSQAGDVLLLQTYDPYRSGELYAAIKKEGIWGEIFRLNEPVNTQFNETHASLSPDGRYLYFTSDRKGGYGGTDIYRATRDGNDWKDPVNLGPLVNTPYNEESPVLSSDSRSLFFSSQGHYNMGGYDIFVAAADENGHWQSPVNIGYPINTTDDDLFFVPVGTGSIAYQARFPDQTAQYDIVRFSGIIPGNPVRFHISGQAELLAEPGFDPTQVSVTFREKSAPEPVAVQQLSGNGSFLQKLPAGSFEVDFGMNGKSMLKKEFDIPANLPQSQLILNARLEIKPVKIADTLVIKDIRFGFNQGNLDDRYWNELDKLVRILEAYPSVLLKIKGYADARGSSRYNLGLSLIRANAVADYLKNCGAPASRISVSAYGEDNPVALNQHPDGSDFPEGRMYNRRVELEMENLPDYWVIIRYDEVPFSLRTK
jgi:outer membrane protein OmpA-like peptidoglycan-associated protein